MSAPKKSKALLKLEKTIGIIDESLENEESREFRDRLRAALAPYKATESTESRRSARVNNYGSKYTTRKGGKKSRKTAKKRHKK